MSKKDTVIKKFKAIQKIGTEVPIPWEVYRLFGTPMKSIQVFGDMICLGEDYADIEEAREAIAWYVEQLGGTVDWE